MSNHTPGPWLRMGHKFGDSLPHYTIEIVYKSQRDDSKNGYSPICFMPDEEFTSETEANARLLAAAPDLLKALEDMVICFERFEDTHTALVMEAARIALGKAVGAKE